MAVIDISENIVYARSFARKCILGQLDKVNQNDYFIFQISKFLLLKESIIKKDNKDKTIYFNILENNIYLDSIIKIVDYVRKNGILESNNINVVIKPEKYNSLEFIKSYIRDFHKIRDTFAHGAYKIDPQNGIIILNNCVNDKDNSYTIKCNLPIEILEVFTYEFVNQIKKDKIPKKEMLEIIKKNRKEFKYYYEIDNENIYDLMKEKIEKEPLITDINNKDYNIDYKKNNKFKNYDYNDKKYIDRISYSYENILIRLVDSLLSRKDLSKEELNKVFKILQNNNIIQKSKVLDPNSIIHNENPDQDYTRKLAFVIGEISSIIGVNYTKEISLLIASVYNYMQTFLSFKHEEITNHYIENNLGRLKMSKINITYINNSNYLTKRDSINRKVKYFIKKYKKNNKGNVNISLRKLISELIDDLAFINSKRIDFIRNAVEHGNISQINDKIELTDRSNQNNPSSVVFRCEATLKDYYELIESIDIGIKNEDFNMSDLFEQLENILDSNIFNEFKGIVYNIIELNREDESFGL